MENIKIAIFKDGKKIRETHLKGEMLLGRSNDCQVVLPDQSVSRQHVSLKSKGDQIELIKRSEFGPVWVNGEECTQAIIKIGDIIKLGVFELEITSDVSPQTVPPVISTPSYPAVLNGDPDIEEIKLESGEEVKKNEIASQTVDIAINEDSKEEDDLSASQIKIDTENNNIAIPGLGSKPEKQSDSREEPFDLADVSQLMELGSNISIEDQGPVVIDEPTRFGEDLSQATAPSLVSDDANTKVASTGKIIPKLVFSMGEASVEEYEIRKDEIVVGRSKVCDIVIMDKKSSRRNTSIQRHGVRFVIRDLDSSNGTYVNGVRVNEQELSGDDEVRIGDIRFHFRVMSRDYEKKKEHLNIPTDSKPPLAPKLSDSLEIPTQTSHPHIPASPSLGMNPPPATPGMGVPIPGMGIPGIEIPGSPGPVRGDQSLLEKYRALPERKRLLYLIVGVVAIWFFFFDDEPAKDIGKNEKPAIERNVSNEKNKNDQTPTPSFESLTKEQQEFIENQYQLSSNLYYNKEYDKALFEVQKIFQLINNYKNSREIERYAEEGKRRMKAQDRERRREKEEKYIQAEILKFVNQARKYMMNQRYVEAGKIFPQILSLDPENKNVARWQNEIDSIAEERQLEEQQKRVQSQINQHGAEIYEQGNQEFQEGRYPASISMFRRMDDIGVSDKKLLNDAKLKIKQAETKIKEIIEPLLAEAKSEEDSGNFSKAYQGYKEAGSIDERDHRGKEGMDRIKGILHERVKVMYTEAVLSESYSDFENAKKLYQKCIKSAPEGDLYLGRCSRKFERFKAFDFGEEEYGE